MGLGLSTAVRLGDEIHAEIRVLAFLDDLRSEGDGLKTQESSMSNCYIQAENKLFAASFPLVAKRRSRGGGALRAAFMCYVLGTKLQLQYPSGHDIR